MFYYQIADVTLKTVVRLLPFEAFVCNCCETDITLTRTTMLPPPGEDGGSGTIVHRRIPGGWFFHSPVSDSIGLYVSEDYTELKLLGGATESITYIQVWFVRIAVECFLVRRGYVSLHAAAVEVNGEAFAFTGPSGIGKSTRAKAWMDELDADLVSGDRPLIDAGRLELYGVPWDGKEQCFRNVHYPLKAICEIRRSETVYARKLSFSQRRKLLMQHCFLPMWDTETASIQIANITRLAAGADIIRAFGGPEQKDVRILKEALDNCCYSEEETDIKAKEGFVLRNIVDEYILMPTGDNIAKFQGTVLLNEVSAFVWEKLQNPISEADLLQAILDEFEVEKAAAAADLDALLAELREYGVIEDD